MGSWLGHALDLFRKRRLGRQPSPLKVELEALKIRYAQTEEYLGELSVDFWRNGGICCPSCGVIEYGDLLMKQERREKRMAELREKLERS